MNSRLLLLFITMAILIIIIFFIGSNEVNIENDLTPLKNKHFLNSSRVKPVEENIIYIDTPQIIESSIIKTPDFEKQVYTFNENGRRFRSLGEKLCCKIIEEYLGRQVLNNIRPDFLKNPKTKRNLELDVYDPILKIAIEYNGQQHGNDDETIDENVKDSLNHFGMSEKDYNDQKYRDKLKIELCKKEGIKLFIVPYTVDSIKSGKKNKYPPQEKREELIKNFLLPKIVDHFIDQKI